MKRLATVFAVMGLLSCAAAHGWKTPMRDLPTGISVEAAQAAELKGDIARAQNDFTSAANQYQKALRAGGPRSQLYNKLGIAQLKLNNQSAARKSFLQAIKYDSRNANALNNLGALMCLQKKYKPAVRYLKQALELDELTASFHVNMAEAWVGLSRIDRAMTEYSRALEIDPDVFTSGGAGTIAQVKTPEQLARMNFLIAKIYAKKGNIEGALDYLLRAKNGHYPQLDDVYVDKEFAVLWQDPRLGKIVKPR
jgi:tetratricopeptide (TPR) repeat protein